MEKLAIDVSGSMSGFGPKILDHVAKNFRPWVEVILFDDRIIARVKVEDILKMDGRFNALVKMGSMGGSAFGNVMDIYEKEWRGRDMHVITDCFFFDFDKVMPRVRMLKDHIFVIDPAEI